MHRRRELALLMVLLVGSSILVFGLGPKQPKSNTPASVVWKMPLQGQAGDYAGAEACSVVRRPERPAHLMRRADFEEHVGCKNICSNIGEALERAEQLFSGWVPSRVSRNPPSTSNPAGRVSGNGAEVF